MPTVANAVIGEPHAAVRIKHNVVWSAQFVAIAFGIQIFQFTGFHVKALNAPTDVVGFHHLSWKCETKEINFTKRSTVIANIQTTVWPKCNSVWTSENFSNGVFRAVWFYARNFFAKHFCHDHAAVRHRNGAFRKTETRCNFSKFSHEQTLRLF